MADQDLSGDETTGLPPDTSAGKVKFAQWARAPFSAASRQIGSAVSGLAGLVKLEVVVTIVCLFIPLLLLYGDDWTAREHISAYYIMAEAQFFYFPLTVAAMLFIVNGVVKEKHWYNVGLGLALAGVILFNHSDHTLIHNAAAGAFFLGNGAVFVIFTPKKEAWFKILLLVAMVVALLGHFVFDWYSLFVAESLSLWVIAFHFILEAKGLIE